MKYAAILAGLLISQFTFAATDCQWKGTIDSVASDGSIVVLMDGSVWKIDDYDSYKAMLWLPVQPVIICRDALIKGQDIVKAQRVQ